MSLRERDFAPLSEACVKALSDKITEKRKTAGLEIEKMVKDFNDANNTNQLRKMIRVLGQDLMVSTNPNVKNGALLGLSSVAVGLGKDSVQYLGDLIPPILSCLNEAPRVRYQAVEALYNVVKIARGASLAHFATLFDALARLSADSDAQVMRGAEVLDRLLKDIVTESAEFSLPAFVACVRERVYGRGAAVRQFVIAWLAVVDAVPRLDLVPLLPDLLDGLFHILDDPNPEIRRMCEIQLKEFLRSIKKDPSRADFPAMVNILIVHAQSPEDLLQLTAISWMAAFVSLAGRAMLRPAAGLLQAVLPCLAYADEPRRNIRETASSVNQQLMQLVAGADDEEEPLDVGAVVGVLQPMLHHSSVHTKVAVLDWLLHLYSTMPQKMSGVTGDVFTAALGVLGEPHDDVVRRGLAVLAEICSLDGPDLDSSSYYQKFIRSLLRLLTTDDSMLEERGAFIIRQVCVLLSAEAVYASVARALVPTDEQRPKHTPALVHLLGTQLLTAPELYPLRTQLRTQQCKRELVRTLYRCWCHSPVSLLALCFLTHSYRHCNRLIAAFGDLEITVDFLTEIDKLVQLIESPIFAYMRLELLSGSAGGRSLRSALFGVLMLLPQSEAFHALRRRLACAPTLHDEDQLQQPPPPEQEIDFDDLLEEFKRVQASYRQQRGVERARRLSHVDRYTAT